MSFVFPRFSNLDRSLMVRSGAIAAGLVFALSSCGSFMPGAVRDADRGATGTGVADDSVKVVFVGIDLDGVKETTGFKTEDAGDAKAQVKALETWVNGNGGLGGRKLNAVFKMYDGQADSPANEEKLCNEVTQDEQAFAVVLVGQFQSNARPCYAQRQTLMLDETMIANDEKIFEELAPYLWAPSHPEFNSFTTEFISTLAEEEFLTKGINLAIVADGGPVSRRAVKDVAIPALEKLGITPTVGWVDSTSTATIYQGVEEAGVTFTSKGVDHVMFLGGSRIASIFATIAGSKDFTARYAISSFDNPTFFVNNADIMPAGIMEDAVGVGFFPGQDVNDKELEFPASDAEKACLDIFSAAGLTFANREGARQALPYCDAAKILKLGADNVDGELNATTWGEAVKANAGDYQTASGFGSGLMSGGHGGAGAVRVMKFDSDLGYFTYVSDEVELAND